MYARLVSIVTAVAILAGFPATKVTAAPPAAEAVGVERGPVFGIVWREPSPGHVVVEKVTKQSPFAALGIREGDLIVAYGDTKVVTSDGLEAALLALKPGDKLPVAVFRDKRRLDVTLAAPAPGERKSATTDGAEKSVASNLFGADLDVTKKGRIVVARVSPDSAADRAKLRPGDVIVAIEDESPRTIAELMRTAEKLAKGRKPGDFLVLTLDRDGRQTMTEVIISEALAAEIARVIQVQQQPVQLAAAQSPLPPAPAPADAGELAELSAELQALQEQMQALSVSIDALNLKINRLRR